MGAFRQSKLKLIQSTLSKLVLHFPPYSLLAQPSTTLQQDAWSAQHPRARRRDARRGQVGAAEHDAACSESSEKVLAVDWLRDTSLDFLARVDSHRTTAPNRVASWCPRNPFLEHPGSRTATARALRQHPDDYHTGILISHVRRLVRRPSKCRISSVGVAWGLLGAWPAGRGDILSLGVYGKDGRRNGSGTLGRFYGRFV